MMANESTAKQQKSCVCVCVGGANDMRVFFLHTIPNMVMDGYGNEGAAEKQPTKKKKSNQVCEEIFGPVVS